MRQTSINKAKKEIWRDLQGLVGDLDFWEQTIEDDNWSHKTFEKALDSVFSQLERKL
jgi:hypothetical protein